jgi:CHAT domain-containing protein/tetratricopeptide (TPR) repeat protein
LKFGLVLALVATLARAGTDDAQTELDKGRQLGDLYNWADAAPYFIEAEHLFNERGDMRNALYAKLGRIRSTMEQVSLPQMSAWLAGELESNPLLKSDDELRLFALIVKGDIDGEINAGPMRRDWESVRDLAQKIGDRRWIYRAGGEIGFTYFLEGDMATARQMVGAALLTAFASNDVGGQIRYLAAVGTGFVLGGNGRDALSYFDKALNVANAHPEVGYQFLVHEGRVLAYKNLSQWKEARAISDEMIAQARSRKKYVKECQALITASGISVAAKDYGRAAAELQDAIRLAGSGGFPRLLADAQADLAELYRMSGDLPRAEEMAQTAADATQSGGEVYLIPGRLELLGRLQALRGEYAAADTSYSKASDFVEAMLAGDPNASGKSGLIMVMSDIYTGHFALLADHFHNASRAYSVLERARGRITLDVLSKATETDRDKAAAVEHQISQLHLKLIAAKSAAQVRQVREQIFLAEPSRWLIEKRTVQTEARRTVSLPQVRKALAPDELILEYVLADPRSYCLVIGRDRTRVVGLLSRAKIEAQVTDAVASVKARRVDRTSLAELYRELLMPIPDLASHKRLIVVPDGRLHLLPFDALIDSAGGYLIGSHVVSYAPSASTYYLLERAPGSHKPAPRVLALGGVPYTSSPSVKLAMTERLIKSPLADLPGSEDEIRVPATTLRASNSTQLAGTNATEAAFKHADLERQDVIHLSVHAVTDESHPDRAALVLMSDPAVGEDGILQAREIMNLRLNADLVVLSACDTAAGRLLGEEGIGTLSRAFQLAGAHSIVSTLWSVDDTFSLNLMKRFYTRLDAAESIAEALTGAKRDLLHEYGDRAVPYYWAGFIADGAADRSIKFDTENGVQTARVIKSE